MKLYEFEGKILLKESGIPVPRGSVVTTVEEAKRVASTIGYPVAIKSQTLGGGRGKSGGIRFAGHEEALTREAGQLFSSGMNGEKIERLLIEEKISVAGEVLCRHHPRSPATPAPPDDLSRRWDGH